MPRDEFKHRYWYFANTPNIGRNVSVIWQDLLWRFNSYLLLKYRGGCTLPLYQISVRCEKCVAARHFDVICKQLLNANDIKGSLSSFRPSTGWALPISLKISARIAYRETYRMLTLSTHLFSHWSIPVNYILAKDEINIHNCEYICTFRSAKHLVKSALYKYPQLRVYLYLSNPQNI